MIYAVSVGEYIKFGYTRNVQKRVQILQTGSPYKLVLLVTCPGNLSVEASIHQRLLKANALVRGEWFKNCPEAQQIIQEMKNNTISDDYATKAELMHANRHIRLAQWQDEPRKEGKARSRHISIARARPGLDDSQLARRREREIWWAESGAALP
jgi:hypothetical protein